jgi:predicted unusual protein kinase regulating ubiquinone biosynthesis (AarF/ABC1/UbiB family)
LAAGSIAQVHRFASDKVIKVAKKVAKKKMEKQFKGLNDLVTLPVIGPLLQATPLGKMNDIAKSIKEPTLQEFNMANEGKLLEKVRGFIKRYRGSRKFNAPKYCSSTEDVLVMEYVEGTLLKDVKLTPEEWQAVYTTIGHFFGELLLNHGIIHGDPHEGNKLLSEDGTLVILDWGLARQLTLEQRNDLKQLCIALKSGAPENDVAEVMRSLEFKTVRGTDKGLAAIASQIFADEEDNFKALLARVETGDFGHKKDPPAVAEFSKDAWIAMRQIMLLICSARARCGKGAPRLLDLWSQQASAPQQEKRVPAKEQDEAHELNAEDQEIRPSKRARTETTQESIGSCSEIL